MLALTHAPSPRMQHCQRTYLPWADVDGELAAAQHAGYCRSLADCGALVRVLNVSPDEPDAVFLEDTAIVLGEFAILCPMGAATRRREPAAMATLLAEYRELKHIQRPAMIEGGDVLRLGRTLLVGQSARTNPAGIAALHRVVAPHGYDVRTVKTAGCLHLKTACTALPDGRLLINPNWIDRAALADFELVSVPAGEPFAANTLPLGEKIILPAEHPQTAALLGQLGWQAVCVELSELLKAEGGVTCLSLLLAERADHLAGPARGIGAECADHAR
jgi:dimethylargininase